MRDLERLPRCAVLLLLCAALLPAVAPTRAAGAEEGATVTFRAPRSVRVWIVEPDGAPVGGLALRLTETVPKL